MFAFARLLVNKVLLFVNRFLKPVQPITDVVDKTKAEPRIPRKYNKEKAQNLSELLDHLDHTFQAVKLPTMNESWLDKDAVIGLKKLGVHVPNPWLMYWDKSTTTVDVTKPLPAIMCVSGASKHNNQIDGMLSPKILFAIKQKKLPWHVAYQVGAPYQFGMAFDMEGKLFWLHMYLTVNRKTGEIKFCDELRINTHVIPIRNAHARKTSGRSKTYVTKGWMPAQFLEDDARTIEESRVVVRNLFANMHEWWSTRDSRWNVVVKKNGDRVTFGVNNDQTAQFFKDRDKSIKTATGQTKKIVHYVKEHARKVKDKTTTVKEHIRGLQDFEWAGYQCKVVSPKLDSQTSATFTTGADYIDEENTEKVVYLSKVAKLLADAEETNRKDKQYA
jgi:hypothetical protein